MSNPSGPYSPGPAPGPGGAPGAGAGGGTGPFPRPQPGAQPPPGARPAAPPPGAGPAGWERRPTPPDKGLFGTLLDTRFDHLVTPKLIRLWYVVALLLISLQCLAFFFLGLWMATWDDWWGWGIIMVVASPVVWLFEVLLVRIVMEAMVVHFKGTEHLRVIRDKL